VIKTISCVKASLRTGVRWYKCKENRRYKDISSPLINAEQVMSNKVNYIFELMKDTV